MSEVKKRSRKEMKLYQKEILIILITAVVYFLMTGLIVLIFIPYRTWEYQLYGTFNLIITSGIMYFIAKKLMGKKYIVNWYSGAILTVAVASLIKWIVNAIDGTFSVVYLALIVLVFVFGIFVDE